MISAQYIADCNLAQLDEYYQHMFAFALADSAAVIASTLDINRVMERILANVGRVVPNETTNIMLIEGDIARVTYWRGFPDHYHDFFGKTRFSLEIGNLRQMMETGDPVIIADTSHYPQWIDHLPEAKTVNSYVGVPICAYSQIIGFLTLGSSTANFFSLTHAERLKAFASQVATAITNAQMYSQLGQHAYELEEQVAERTSELTIANERLQELDWLKTKIIADISHKLRTPITNLNLRVYLIENDRPEKQTGHLHAFKNDLDRLNELIEGVIEFEHLETTKSLLIFDEFNLNKLLLEI